MKTSILSSDQVLLIRRGDRQIKDSEITDQDLKRIVPRLCIDLIDEIGDYKMTFDNLLNIEYDNFSIWLLKWTEGNYNKEKDPSLFLKHVKETLSQFDMVQGIEYSSSLISENNVEFVMYIEFYA